MKSKVAKPVCHKAAGFFNLTNHSLLGQAYNVIIEFLRRKSNEKTNVPERRSQLFP